MMSGPGWSEHIDETVNQELSIDRAIQNYRRLGHSIMIERLWRSVKYEEVYLKDYQSVKDANEGLNNYAEWNDTISPTQKYQRRKLYLLTSLY